MRFKIDIVHEVTRADSSAIDYHTEFWIDVFEFFEVNALIDCAAGFLKSIGEVVEINRGVHERNVEREAGGERTRRNI